MQASIVVSNLEPEGRLLPSIHALCTQDFKGHYEVILPDFHNHTPEEEVVLRLFEEEYPHFRILRTDDKNRAVLMDAGVQEAKSGLVLFAESHCIADKHFVTTFVKKFNNKEVGAAYMDIRDVPSACCTSNMVMKHRERILAGYADKGLAAAYFDFHSSAIRRSCLEKVGGLHTQYGALVEFELGARLNAHGVKIHVMHDKVWHFNNVHLQEYGRIIFNQGVDRAKVLERKSMRSYFLNPKFLRLRKVLRVLRLPVFVVTSSLVVVGAVGYKCSVQWFPSMSTLFFRMFAKNIVRSGMLYGLRS